MATCKRCGWRRAVISTTWVQDTIYDNGVGAYVETERPCPDCKGTGEVGDDSERESDNTNKGDGDGE